MKLPHVDSLESAAKVTVAAEAQGANAFFSKPRFIDVARTAFWTLCVCAYVLGIWCTLALEFDLRLLHFTFDFYVPAFANWPKEAIFTSQMYEITSLAMIPFIISLRRSRPIVACGLGVWSLEIFWFFAPLFY